MNDFFTNITLDSMGRNKKANSIKSLPFQPNILYYSWLSCFCLSYNSFESLRMVNS